jgi:nucleotide-binding universal stress UspA family protein
MILCGTDLGARSAAAVTCAAALAQKRGEDLLLVTVLSGDGASERMKAGVQLEHDAAELRHDFDISVETLVAHGAPEVALATLAAEHEVDLIVVGARGEARHTRFLGSVPEHLCQRSPVPVLVCRREEGLVEWCRGRRQLRVLVGSGMGSASRSALDYVAAWPDAALSVAHVAWPYGEQYRLGLTGAMPLEHLRPEVHQRLVGDLERWVSDAVCPQAPKLRVTPGWGRVDSHLAALSAELEADVLVVGNHRRNLAERAWHGSISRGVMHEATCNVLCVPELARPARLRASPRVIVAATDLTPLSARALPHAYGLLRGGGALHLVHVTAETHPAELERLRAELSRLVPPGAREVGIDTALSVVQGSVPWLAVWQYAGRVRAELICMATHSREAAAALVLGSQAQGLLQHSQIPVLLVPPDREG